MKLNPVPLLTICCCVVGFSSALLRQYGGKDTSVEHYPFVAAITFHRELYGNGAILARKWVLSAASSFYQTPDSAYDVAVGTDDFRSGAQWHEVLRIFRHPEFVGWDFNIALVRLKMDITYSFRIQPIIFGTTGTDHLEAMMVSYGKNEDDTTHLREARYTLTVNDDCINHLTSYPAMAMVREGQGFCLVPFPDGPAKGQWYNDAGAPIVAYDELFGVFAFNEDHGGTSVGAVATRVSFFKDWIQATMDKN